jgi:uncharacterized membrane protein YraQ (UPF0718 family)
MAFFTLHLPEVWPYIVGGIGAGALIHGYVPEQLIVRWGAGPEKWFAVPLAVAIGVPLYANIAGVLPITEALVNKGCRWERCSPSRWRSPPCRCPK